LLVSLPDAIVDECKVAQFLVRVKEVADDPESLLLEG
jgi:hypothetical protein